MGDCIGVDFSTPIEEYEWQLVTTEEQECSCGAYHDEGESLWGGLFKPEDMGEHNPTAGVKTIHDVDMELIHNS